jgi:hypothetical protein
VGSSPQRRARAGKSHRRQSEEGVEASVEVDVEVPGTRAVLGVEQVWPEEDRCRLTSWMLSVFLVRRQGVGLGLEG